MNDKTYNVENILSGVLAGFSERSQDVIVSRFGIGKDDYETLEAIGQRYNITRERVRQIEADTLKQMRSENSGVAAALNASLENFLRSKGGVADEENLTGEFTKSYLTGQKSPHQYKGFVRFLLSLDGRFKKVSANDNFTTRWHLKKEDLERQEKMSKELAAKLKRSSEVISEDKLVTLAQSSLPGLLAKEAILSYLVSSKNIKKNVFGQWGLAHWAEIKPRGVKDKAYLVMKQENKPLHFREVAGLINENEFSNRQALAQTVHNELIKDERFVLVGRGLYALREWGYKEGTVKDVIERVLHEKGPLAKDKIIEAVLAERFVKPSTVILNLNSFKKDSNNKYTLA